MVVGGLALSAILTLAIVPPLLTLVAGTAEAGRKHRAALKEAPAE